MASASLDFYNELIDIIAKQSYGPDVFASLYSGEMSMADFQKLANQLGYTVVYNTNGDRIIGAVKNTTESIIADNGAEVINSNFQTGTSAAANTTKIPVAGDMLPAVTTTGKNVVKGTSKIKKFVSGVEKTGHFIGTYIAEPIYAVSAGVKLGKTVDSAIYHIGDALGLNPPSELDPATWGSLVSDLPDTGIQGAYKQGFYTLFDIEPETKQTQMYMDENALAYMALWMKQQGFFNTGDTTVTPADKDDVIATSAYIQKHLVFFDNINSAMDLAGIVALQGDTKDFALYKYFIPSQNQIFATNENPSAYNYTNVQKQTDSNNPATAILAWSPDLPCYNQYISGDGHLYSWGGGLGNAQNTPTVWRGRLGTIETSGGSPDGVYTADGATTPDLSNADTIDDILTALKEQFPSWWENRVENTVEQPDGTTTTYTYIPVPVPSGGEGINPSSKGQLQTAGAVEPATATDTQLSDLVKWLTNGVTKPSTDPDDKTDPYGVQKPLTGDPTLPNGPTNPADTGEGDTPVVVLPEGHANALYAIYNPTQSQLNSLGAWLWSSDFVDQLLKLFSDPMQAIIGLHKIYATPATGGEQNIKVGFLDSGVSSKIVTDQYTTVDCGSVNLFEYFGNVFDYAPYTQLRLYLPFIGIVNLDTEDAMRGVIHVVYHVDVLSGACLAEVRITRDAAGGTLYQYAGNAAVTMPISSGSYIGVIANVVGVASSAIGGFASGGVAGGIAGGVTGALTRRGGTQVQHSGNFSGNAGAMGIKKPYLIIERPQTALADNYAEYIGNPSNTTVTLSSCTGYIKMKEVHLENVPATGAELSEIEQTLKQGVII